MISLASHVLFALVPQALEPWVHLAKNRISYRKWDNYFANTLVQFGKLNNNIVYYIFHKVQKLVVIQPVLH